MDEHNAEKFGAAVGEHASNTFYKAIKFCKNGQCRILTLGEFFYMKITKLKDVCVGELQMIWTNKQDENQLICSVRIYVLPVNTSEGRNGSYGEDEILAMSEKLILKVNDLIPLLTDHVTWTAGRQLFHEDDIKEHEEEFRNIFVGNRRGLNFSDVEKEKDNIGDKGDETSTPLTILSFAEYCRYRGVLKRLENMVDKWLRNAIICAIGGIVTTSKHTRIMFCKSTVDIPELDDLEIRCDHLAPSLKGRPRKKKSSSKGDSDSYETASDISTTTYLKPKETVNGKRESALRNGMKFDNSQVSTDEQEFLFNLHRFMKKRNTPICRIPSLGFKQVDLYYFYTYAQKLGGYEMVTQKRLWKHLYDKLGGNPGSTSAATCTRRHYEKLLLPFERYDKGRNIEKKGVKEKRDRLLKQSPHKETIPTSPPTKAEEPKRVPKIKRRFKTTLTLKQRAEQWEHLRKLKEKEKSIKGRRPGRPRTVKNLLDSSEKEKKKLLPLPEIKAEPVMTEVKEEKVEMKEKDDKEIKTEKEEEVIKETSETESVENDKSVNTSSVLSQTADATSVFSQSKLFQHNAGQLNSCASSSLNPVSKSVDQQFPSIPVHPQAAMFYPQTFIPTVGGVHPMGLPIMHHMPLALPPFLQPSTPTISEKQQTFRPNILRNSSSHKNMESKLNSSALKISSYPPHSPVPNVSPAHAHSRHRSSMSPPSTDSSPVLMVPPAHSNGIKRPYTHNHIPIPGSVSHSSSNKSLLFDFESPKRPKMEGSSHQSNKSNYSEEPTDLSMKTLRKKEISETSDSIKQFTSDLSKQFTSDSIKQFTSDSSKNYKCTNHSSEESIHSLLHRVKSPATAHTSSKQLVTSPSVGSEHPADIMQHVFNKHQTSVFSPSFHPNSNVSDRGKVQDGYMSLMSTKHKIQESQSSKSLELKSQSASRSSIDSSTKKNAPELSMGMVHPAFLHPMMRPSVPLQPGFFPTPLQLQQLYQAQLRASAAYDGMLQRDRNSFPAMPLPMFIPQVPLYAQSHKDKK